jgi:hypothetical protein
MCGDIRLEALEMALDVCIILVCLVDSITQLDHMLIICAQSGDTDKRADNS